MELLDDGIGARGCLALGAACSQGHNLSLLTLKLDFNSQIGAQGAQNLCRGLRSNMTLRQLHMQFCQITHEAGPALGELVSNSKSSLEVLNLSGNRLGGLGLYSICSGLTGNTCLQTLALADNLIDQSEDDLVGIRSLRDALLEPESGLTSVDLMYNRIGEAGAQILVPALGPENTKIAGEVLCCLVLCCVFSLERAF